MESRGVTEELTYYELFGLDETASVDTITEVFREISLRLKAKAPDLNEQQLASAHNLFTSVQEAYEVLRDPVKRAQYDARRKKIDEDKKEELIASSMVTSITSETIEAMATTATTTATVTATNPTDMPLKEQSNVNDVVMMVATAMVAFAVTTATDKTVEIARQEEEDAIADQIELDNFLNERTTTDSLVEASRDQIQRLLSSTNGSLHELQRNLDISNQSKSDDTNRMTPISILKTPETPRDPERRKTVTFVDPVLHILISQPASRSTSGDRSSLEVLPPNSDILRSSLPRPDEVLSFQMHLFNTPHLLSPLMITIF